MEADRATERYAVYDEIASGGMATVHVGRMLGAVGFSRTVAIKRLHAQFAKDPDFVSMFLDEARLASRVRHPNVVATVDVVARAGELFLVMEYVQGESLSKLWRRVTERSERIPVRIAVGIAAGVLYGLHAAHEAKNERGERLEIIHRDVSPQNVLVGDDGVARVLDFGIAKAAWRMHQTRDDKLKGKLGYMAPEQLKGERISRAADVFAASVVLWELLTGRHLFSEGEEPAIYVARLLGASVPSPRQIVPDVPHAIDDVVRRGLSLRPSDRFATAHDMAVALETAVAPATPREIGEWVRATAGSELDARARRVAQIESSSAVRASMPSLPTGIIATLGDAALRNARSELPTSQLDAPYVEPKKSRSRAYLWGIALVAFGGSLVALSAVRMPSAPTQMERPPPPEREPAEAGASEPPSVSSASSVALSPQPSTTASSSAPAAPVAKPAARASGTSASHASKPAASNKLCMKTRADGIVYFEPCR